MEESKKKLINPDRGMCISELDLHGIKDRIDKINGNADWKVRIAYPDGSRSCIGKIVGITDGKEGEILLFPVPENIEAINSATRMMVLMCCDKAASGVQCCSCADLQTCKTMETIDTCWKNMLSGRGSSLPE